MSGTRATQNLRIAVPKGSLFADTVRMLADAGLDTGSLADPGRRLIVSEGGVDYIIVRPTDAPVLVAGGGADCGICGKDTLVEAALDVLELVDLKYGYCRFVEAEPRGRAGEAEEAYERLGVLRVATKYPRVTGEYYERRGIQADIVRMHGNIELAPIVGMAERIVDITATGRTLKENDLVVTGEVMASTARFIASPSAVRTDPRVVELAESLEALCENAEETMSS